jgi:hypothetical protein
MCINHWSYRREESPRSNGSASRSKIFGTRSLLPSHESRAACGAALLPIPAGKHCTLLGNPVDVRRLVTHHTAIVTTRIKPADIIAHDDKECSASVLFSAANKQHSVRWLTSVRKRPPTASALFSGLPMSSIVFSLLSGVNNLVDKNYAVVKTRLSARGEVPYDHLLLVGVRTARRPRPTSNHR